jgi:hypothetical protein
MSVTGIRRAAAHPLHSATTQPDALKPHGKPVGFQIYVHPISEAHIPSQAQHCRYWWEAVGKRSGPTLLAARSGRAGR